MNAAVIDSKNSTDYVVADMSLAAWGRKELTSPKPKCPASCRRARNIRRNSR